MSNQLVALLFKDGSGNPLVGISVLLFPGSETNLVAANALDGGVTDAKGFFQTSALSPGAVFQYTSNAASPMNAGSFYLDYQEQLVLLDPTHNVAQIPGVPTPTPSSPYGIVQVGAVQIDGVPAFTFAVGGGSCSASYPYGSHPNVQYDAFGNITIDPSSLPTLPTGAAGWRISVDWTLTGKAAAANTAIDGQLNINGTHINAPFGVSGTTVYPDNTTDTLQLSGHAEALFTTATNHVQLSLNVSNLALAQISQTVAWTIVPYALYE